MEFVIFALLSILAFLLLLYNQNLPLEIVNCIIAGFIFMILGGFVLAEGITVDGNIVKDSSTLAISIIYLLFGISNAVISAVFIKK
jgi:hypothetical protein